MADALKLAIYGINDSSKTYMELTFQKFGEGNATVTEEEESEAGLFYLTDPDTKLEWERYRREYADRPTIVIAETDPKFKQAIYIPKPLSMSVFFNTIKEIRATIDKTSEPQSDKSVTAQKPYHMVPVMPEIDDENDTQDLYEECGHANDIELTDSEQRKQIYYSVKDKLQGEIQAAIALADTKGKAVVIALDMDGIWESITFLPSKKQVVSTIEDEQLKYLCSSPVFCLKKKTLILGKSETDDAEQLAEKTGNAVAVDAFLWKIVLWSSQGKLPVGTKLNEPIRLKRWPNMSRIPLFPNAMSIAALLFDRPVTLALLVKVLHIPQRRIFSFYSAATSLGLIENVIINNDSLILEEQLNRKNSNSGLFGRLLNRLRRVA